MRSVHSCLLPGDVDLGSAAHTHVDFDRKPRTWKDRPQFGELSDDWIFGYGSLVDPDDLARYVGNQAVEGIDWTLALLDGYERAWNVGMRNVHDCDDDKFYVTEDGQRYGGIVLTLGLDTNSGSSTNGLMFKVERPALLALDKRERRYHRVDVSSSIESPAQLSPGSTVYTYVPRADALATGLEGIHSSTAAISRSYHDKVTSAFNRLGKEEVARYQASTRQPKAPLVDLHVVRPGTERRSRG